MSLKTEHTGSYSGSYLLWPEAGGHPGVLLQRTARVIIGCGASLAPKGEFAHLGLHLQRHNQVKQPVLSVTGHQTMAAGTIRKKKIKNLKALLLPSKSFY